MLRAVLTRLKQFKDEAKGSVSIEFMLVLPLLLWWYAASFAFYDAFRSYNVTVKSSYMMGDILSRQLLVDNDYLDGVEDLFEFMNNSSTGVWVRVSSVNYSTSDGYTIDWSYATDSNDELVTSDIFSKDIDEDFLPIMANGESVILSETYVPYSPVYGVGLLGRTWSNVVVTRPRFTSKLANTDYY